MALEEGQLDDAREGARSRRASSPSKQKLPPLEVYALRAALELSRDRRS